MAQRTINRFYSTYVEAVQVVADLTDAGVPSSDISLIESEDDARLPADVSAETAQNPVVTGLTLGLAIGGGLGALDGIGAITIPFTEPLTQPGWVVPCIAFAVAGAILGAIIGKVVAMGKGGNQSRTLAAGLQRGEHLVMVRVEELDLPQVEVIMSRTHAQPVSPLPEPIYDDEYVPDNRTVAQEAAAIHREERRIQFE
jgi:hypothetical protein